MKKKDELRNQNSSNESTETKFEEEFVLDDGELESVQGGASPIKRPPGK